MVFFFALPAQAGIHADRNETAENDPGTSIAAVSNSIEPVVMAAGGA
jgi:hypothetical protein